MTQGESTQTVASKEFEHLAVSVSLRAPRVAIVVPVTQNWHFIAATAIHRATRIWGGAGFIMIPHERGIIEDLFIRMAVNYDPDHVVTIHDVPLVELEKAGACEWEFSGERPSADLMQDLKISTSPYDDDARTRLAEACTPYRFGVHGERESHEGVFYLEAGSTLGASLSAVEPPEGLDVGALSIMKPATRDIALIRAERFGLVHPPRAEDDEEATGNRPDLLGTNALDYRTAGGFGWWSSAESAWSGGLNGLTQVGTPVAVPINWIVVGAEFADYALSYALGRIEGNSIWIPSGWLEPDSDGRAYVYGLCRPLFWAARAGSKVAITSMSLSMDEMESAMARLRTMGVGLGVNGQQLSLLPHAQVEVSGADHHLVLSRDYDHELLLPTRRPSEDPQTIALSNALPAILPESDFGGLDVQSWHLDVDLRGRSMPSGRGLPWHALQMNDTGRWPERTRSGRDGVSVASGSFGFVSTGASRRQRLARPVLRFPSAMAWVGAMSEKEDYKVAVSAAGHKVKIAADIWGGRDRMAAVLQNHLAMFNEFICSSSDQKTSERYPDGGGCAIRGEGFLTFEGLSRASQTPEADLVHLRTTVDELGGLGVVRRGLILGCPSCTRTQWIQASEITKAICGRCQATIPLNRSSWHDPVGEPLWFYDLHPVVRDVITECGHVAVLAGRHLQPTGRYGSTVLPDVEFKRGTDHFEIDLVVASRRKVIVGECKHQPVIPRNEIKKKLHALVQSAVVLRADEIVLAAGQPGTWDDGFVSKLAERVGATAWTAGRRPRIRLLTNVLGAVTDQYHVSQPGDGGSGVTSG